MDRSDRPVLFTPPAALSRTSLAARAAGLALIALAGGCASSTDPGAASSDAPTTPLTAPTTATRARAGSGAVTPADFARLGEPPAPPPTSLTTRQSTATDAADAPNAASAPIADPAGPAIPTPTTPPSAPARATSTPGVLEISGAPGAPGAAAKSSPPASPALDVQIGATPTLESSARPASSAVVLDARVGQVNGRPIFASEILEPLDGRLRRLGTETRTKDVWVRTASRSIYDELLRRVRDELILAEARANLTTDQRRGLLFFLNDIQENLVRANRGSAVAADEALRQSTSRSLAQEAQDRLDRELIANELRTRVVPRVVVPWRDVKQEYESNFLKYNPPPIARLRLITADAADPAARGQIESALASGTPFAQVATLPANNFKRREAGDYPQEIAGALADTKLSEIAEIDKAMRGLSVGQTVGPVEYSGGSRLAWVHLESIEQQPGKTLYEAQFEIEAGLREDRFRQEEMRYFDNLLKRGNMSKFEDMMTQLIQIAQERYLPAKLSGPAPAKP